MAVGTLIRFLRLRLRRGSTCLDAPRRLQKCLILLPRPDRDANTIRRSLRPQRSHRYAFIQQAVRIGGRIFSQITKQKIRRRWNYSISQR